MHSGTTHALPAWEPSGEACHHTHHAIATKLRVHTEHQRPTVTVYQGNLTAVADTARASKVPTYPYRTLVHIVPVQQATAGPAVRQRQRAKLLQKSFDREPHSGAAQSKLCSRTMRGTSLCSCHKGLQHCC